jgi:DNA-binding response OmpR family regulator
MKKKILIIDDDPNVADYLATFLSDSGYETYTAADVKEGLTVAKKQVPDLITLDIEMPGEWGPRFHRHLSQEKKLKNIPIIVISGLSGSEYAVGKAVASLSKPFDRDELLDVIKDTLE